MISAQIIHNTIFSFFLDFLFLPIVIPPHEFTYPIRILYFSLYKFTPFILINIYK